MSDGDARGAAPVGSAAVRPEDATSDRTMSVALEPEPILPVLDAETVALVVVAAAVAAADETRMRDALRAAVGRVRGVWVEEVILQSYLFAGFPRALNAMRDWRTISGEAAPAVDPDPIAGLEPGAAAAAWRERGEATCSEVYGRFYAHLRVNIAALHPALDAWMVAEGYGKVLGRPGLDLARRELCVVAACVAAQQDRQLHSHLHGAVHAGASPAAVSAALEVALQASAGWLDPDAARRYRQLWAKVIGKSTHNRD